MLVLCWVAVPRLTRHVICPTPSLSYSFELRVYPRSYLDASSVITQCELPEGMVPWCWAIQPHSGGGWWVVVAATQQVEVGAASSSSSHHAASFHHESDGEEGHGRHAHHPHTARPGTAGVPNTPVPGADVATHTRTALLWFLVSAHPQDVKASDSGSGDASRGTDAEEPSKLRALLHLVLFTSGVVAPRSVALVPRSNGAWPYAVLLDGSGHVHAIDVVAARKAVVAKGVIRMWSTSLACWGGPHSQHVMWFYSSSGVSVRCIALRCCVALVLGLVGHCERRMACSGAAVVETLMGHGAACSVPLLSGFEM